ncbi:MAG: YggT family protein [Pseudomonadales bacterium]|nr:YggT family protein [Pseudomonadales bacterium]
MNVSGALNFIVIYLFDIYIMIVFTRFLLQMVRADFYNPVSQFVVKATTPVLKPLRRIVPGFGGLDNASLVLLALLVIAKIIAWSFINFQAMLPVGPLMLLSLKSIALTLVNYFMLIIFVGAIMSWVVQGYHPVSAVLFQLSDPIVAPLRRLIPSAGGIDFSPMIVMLGLYFLKILFQLDRAMIGGYMVPVP